MGSKVHSARRTPGHAAPSPSDQHPPTGPPPTHPPLLPSPLPPHPAPDPHPGNLLATREGNLVYLDFGMMSEAPQARVLRVWVGGGGSGARAPTCDVVSPQWG